jgi:hypothetical protein
MLLESRRAPTAGILGGTKPLKMHLTQHAA